MNTISKIDFLNIGDTIIDSNVLGNFLNRKIEPDSLFDFIFSTIKVLEAIVLHEKLYSLVLNQPETDFLSSLQEVNQIILAFPNMNFDNKGAALRFEDRFILMKGRIAFDSNFSMKIQREFFLDTGLSYTAVTVDTQMTDYQKYQANTLVATAEEAKKQILENDEWTVGNFFHLDAPLIFNYIVNNSSSFDDMIKNALDLRVSKEEEYFRKMSKAFENAVKTNDSDNAVFIIDEMKNAILQLSQKTSKTPLIPIDVSIPLGFSINIKEVLGHLQIPPRYHINFISRLYNSAIRSTGTIDKFVEFLKKDGESCVI